MCYKLTQTFADAGYVFTIGGDGGYQLSLDGVFAWIINLWNEPSYGTTTLTTNVSGAKS